MDRCNCPKQSMEKGTMFATGPAAGGIVADAPNVAVSKLIPKRPLGKSGEKPSIVGSGGVMVMS